MSRILRRPMFRGGPVSSYGTGIADGLGTPRVGLDKGGTWWDRFQNWTSRNVPAGEGITGAEVVKKTDPLTNRTIDPQSGRLT